MLTQEQETHLEIITDILKSSLRAKYEKGAKEHGGNLWEKEDLLLHALEEVLDLFTYIVTLIQQDETKSKKGI